jgi:hypothetical protein
VSAAVETIGRLEEELARVLGAERLATLHESLTEISNTFGET